MMFSECNVPAPTNEDQFEALCVEIFRHVWRDPNAQQNGRRGQRQAGVDAFGRREGNDKPSGVQSKVRIEKLTEREIKDEVEKAKTFKPPLCEFIIATTLPRDAKTQEIVRLISQANEALGLFSVAIWSWDDLKKVLDNLPELQKKFFPFIMGSSGSGPADNITETTRQIIADQPSQAELTPTITQPPNSTTFPVSVSDLSIAVLSSEYQAELDQARDLLNNHKPTNALEALTRLKQRIWHNADASVRFRLTTNLGSAQAALGHDKEAGQLFIEALQYKPDDEKALVNAALGHHFLGGHSEASSLAMKALEKNRFAPGPWSLLIQIADVSEPFDDLLARVPEQCRNTPQVAFALSEAARKRNLTTQAMSWNEIAIKCGGEKEPEVLASMGQHLLASVTEDKGALLADQLSDQAKTNLVSAIQHLEKAWELIPDDQLRKLKLTWMINRSMAKELSGDKDGSLVDAQLALQLDKENSHAIKHIAVLHFQNKRYAEAANLMEQIYKKTEVAEAGLLLAEAYHVLKRYEDAVRVAQESLEGNLRGDLRIEIERFLITTYLAMGKPADAQKFAEARLAKSPNDPLALTQLAQVHRVFGNRESAVNTILQAKAILTAESPVRERLAVANLLYDLDQHGDAAIIYETVADKRSDSELNNRLLSSWYAAGELGKALEVCQSLLSKKVATKFVATVASAIYEEIGDLPAAKAACETGLKKIPNDNELELRLAVVNLRSNNLQAVDAFLNQPKSWVSVSFAMALQVAQLFAVRRRFREALDMAYELRRRHFDQPEAHSKYVGMFFHCEKHLSDVFSTPTVQNGCVITLG